MRNPSIVGASAGALLLLASLVGAASAAGLQDAKTTPLITTDGLTWTEVNAENFPKGMKFAVLVSSGDYSVARVWLPPHSVIPPHMHSGNAEAVTLVEGNIGFGFGEEMDMTQPMVGPGAFFVLAEGDYHYVWTGDEPAIWDVQVENSSDTTFAPMKM
jgi:quercetin dioxygenase-like cupin family protein